MKKKQYIEYVTKFSHGETVIYTSGENYVCFCDPNSDLPGACQLSVKDLDKLIDGLVELRKEINGQV